MIFTREYKPNADDLIYHYCDAITFHSICSNRKLWFNDLHSMNDSKELYWGYSIWEEAAGNRQEKYGKEFLDRIDKIIHYSGYLGLTIACCFSTEKDVLSQWRAYADDGKGYVIGFNASDLLQLPVRALKVLYDKQQQIKESSAVIDMLYEIEKTDNENFDIMCELFGRDFAAFKNPSFSEEKEIRLIHLLDYKKSNSFFKLTDEGGQYFGKETKGELVQYRIKQNIPTPYVEFDFTNNNSANPIREVIVGPKNPVLLSAISIYLETIGIGKVIVGKSEASYR